MKTAKLGAIFLVSTIALAGIGAAYAWWVDELEIDVDVKLGTFGWEWTLDWYTDDFEITHDYKDIIDIPRDATGAPLVDDHVYLEDTQENDPTHPGFEHMDKLHIYADHVYPCTDIEIWPDLHFWGTVPGHLYQYSFVLTLDEDINDPNNDPIILDTIPKWMYVQVQVVEGSPSILDDMDIEQGAIMGICEFFDRLTPTQWHQSYYLNLFIYIHWIQWDMVFTDHWGNEIDCSDFMDGADDKFDVPMNAKITFDIEIDGCQYNDPDYGGPIP
jgi:hypothetical protein